MPPLWNVRYDLFQLLLEEHGLKPTLSTATVFGSPPTSVLVVVCNKPFSPEISGRRLQEFVIQGGIVLLAYESDFLKSSRLLPISGVGAFSGWAVEALDRRFQYEGFADCLRVTNIRNVDGAFDGIRTLVANRTGWFEPESTANIQWHVVAQLPENTKPARASQQPLLVLGHSNLRKAGPTATGSTSIGSTSIGSNAGGSTTSGSKANARSGTYVVLADTSLLTNGMLWHGDNSLLALRLSELLSQDRTQYCFLTNNQILGSATERLMDQLQSEQDDPALPEERQSNMTKLLRLGNALAQEVGKSNVINQALRQQPRNLSPQRYFRILLGVLSLAAVGWIVWKILTSRASPILLIARRQMRPAYELTTSSGAGTIAQPLATWLVNSACSVQARIIRRTGNNFWQCC